MNIEVFFPSSWVCFHGGCAVDACLKWARERGVKTGSILYNLKTDLYSTTIFV